MKTGENLMKLMDQEVGEKDQHKLEEIKILNLEMLTKLNTK